MAAGTARHPAARREGENVRREPQLAIDRRVEHGMAPERVVPDGQPCRRLVPYGDEIAAVEAIEHARAPAPVRVRGESGVAAVRSASQFTAQHLPVEQIPVEEHGELTAGLAVVGNLTTARRPEDRERSDVQAVGVVRTTPGRPRSPGRETGVPLRQGNVIGPGASNNRHAMRSTTSPLVCSTCTRRVTSDATWSDGTP